MRTPTNSDVRRVFDKCAEHYDRQIGMCERWLFPGSRQWAMEHVRGHVVEIAVGTGLNLPLYPADVRVTGVELSEQMLRIARQRVARCGLDDRVELHLGDAQAMNLPDASADTVVSTLTLCSIPDPHAAAAEAYRLLRPGGQFVLVEHGASTNPVVHAGLRLAERLTVPFAADNLTRDPVACLETAGFRVDTVSRAKAGISFHILATKPA